MILLFIPSCMCVLLISLIIAIYVKKHYGFGKYFNIDNYLFGNNTIFTATCSNIGSILSLTTVFGVFIGSILSCGIESIIFLSSAVLIGYLLFAMIVNRIFNNSRLNQGMELDYKIESNITTIVGIVDSKAQPVFRSMQILLYFLFLLIEFVIAKIFLVQLFPNSLILIHLTLFILTSLCALYVSVGGFAGVLRTDIFQVLMVFLCCFVLFLNYNGELAPLIRYSIENIQFTPKKLFIYPGYFLFIFLYCFALPDLWIRNIGTLKIQKGYFIPSLVFSAIGIVIILIPCIFLGLYLSAQIPPNNGIITLPNILLLIASNFIDSSSSTMPPITTLLLIIGCFCMFITTIDTWLIGINQHLFQKCTPDKRNIIKILPFLVTGGTWCISIYIDYSTFFYFIGLVLSLILYGNFLVFIKAMKRGCGFNGMEKKDNWSYLYSLISYYLIGIFSNLVMIIFLKPMKEFMGPMLLTQLVIGLIIFFVIPDKFKKKRIR